MNSVLLFVLLFSFTALTLSQDSTPPSVKRTLQEPGYLRDYSESARAEFMDHMAIVDANQRIAKLREWGVKNGKNATEITDGIIDKIISRRGDKEKK